LGRGQRVVFQKNRWDPDNLKNRRNLERIVALQNIVSAGSLNDLLSWKEILANTVRN
jgi:hypothetical protein